MPSRAQIVAAARDWCGTPFHYHAALKGVGCDCLGLVRGIFSEVYGREPEPIPTYAVDWAEAERAERLIDGLNRHLTPMPSTAAQPGDVLVFRWRDGLPASHLGVMSAVSHMVHTHQRLAVCEVALVPAWRRRIAVSFSFPGLGD